MASHRAPLTPGQTPGVLCSHPGSFPSHQHFNPNVLIFDQNQFRGIEADLCLAPSLRFLEPEWLIL